MRRPLVCSSALAILAGCFPSVPAPGPGLAETASAVPAPAPSARTPSIPGPIEIVQRSDALTFGMVVTDEHVFTTERIERGVRIMKAALEPQVARQEVFRARDIYPTRAGAGLVALADDDDVRRAAHVDPTGKVTWFGPADAVAWDDSTRSVVVARPQSGDGSFEIVTASPEVPTEVRTLATIRANEFSGPADALAASGGGVAFGRRVSRDWKLEPFGVFFLPSGAQDPLLLMEVFATGALAFVGREVLVMSGGGARVGPPSPGGLAAVGGWWENFAIDGDVVYAYATFTHSPDATHPGSAMIAWRRGGPRADVAIDTGTLIAIGLGRDHVYWVDDTTHTVKRTRRLAGY